MLRIFFFGCNSSLSPLPHAAQKDTSCNCRGQETEMREKIEERKEERREMSTNSA